jgi:hypothetical protein
MPNAPAPVRQPGSNLMNHEFIFHAPIMTEGVGQWLSKRKFI